jgi:molybdopterin-binding protein
MLLINDISVHFPEFSLRNVGFSVQEGDYFILLGRSGAGKSMVLETLAGLIRPAHGQIILDGREITREKIQNRPIGLVFQDHAIFPHLSVRKNLGYSLHGSDIPASVKRQRILETARELGIGNLLDRMPGTLSGGELQRVALGRTLIQQPRILLLDEPLSSLDAKMKTDLRRLLRRIHSQGQTILHVTHDYEEALALGTRIAVIEKGEIVQTGTPQEVFHQPKNEFIAAFTGIRNFLPAIAARADFCNFAEVRDDLRFHIIDDLPGGAEIYIMVRGEDILISEDPVDTSAMNNFRGVVCEISPSKGGMDVVVDIGVEMHAWVTAASVERLHLATGTPCWIHFKATAVKTINR